MGLPSEKLNIYIIEDKMSLNHDRRHTNADLIRNTDGNFYKVQNVLCSAARIAAKRLRKVGSW